MINKQFYSFFSRRVGANAAVRHITSVNRILDNCGYKKNIVDVISNLMQEESLDEMQIKSIIPVILCDKWNYLMHPMNIPTRPKNADLIINTISLWTGVDIVLTYEAKELGFVAINPKNPASRDALSLFRQNELLTIYAGYQGRGRLSYDIFLTIIDAINKMFKGEECEVSKAILEGKYIYKAMPEYILPFNKKNKIPKDEITVSFATSPYRMTKFFPIKIADSDFNEKHLKSWRRIIKDYTGKYKNASIYIFYKGELVSNFEKLVKTGMLKQGSILEVSVKDLMIQDVARLFKYLQESLSDKCDIFVSDLPDMRGNLF